jgi:hypothetical protein
MDEHAWDRANELEAEVRRRFAALRAGAIGGVTRERVQTLEREWRIAQREWWDEIDRVVDSVA